MGLGVRTEMFCRMGRTADQQDDDQRGEGANPAGAEEKAQGKKPPPAMTLFHITPPNSSCSSSGRLQGLSGVAELYPCTHSGRAG